MTEVLTAVVRVLVGGWRRISHDAAVRNDGAAALTAERKAARSYRLPLFMTLRRRKSVEISPRL